MLAGATAVVSTLGGFGSEEQMQRINGEANILAVNAAKKFGEELFISLVVIFQVRIVFYMVPIRYLFDEKQCACFPVHVLFAKCFACHI